MGGPKGVNDIPIQDETRSLLIPARIEDNLSLAVVVVARTRIAGLNPYRSTELLRASSKVERVHPLKVRSGILAHRHHVDGAVRTGCHVYNRRCRNPDFRDHLATV